MSIYVADLLAGCRIFVTGASSGLGRAAAIGLSRLGASIALCGRHEGRLAETAAQLAGEGHLLVPASITDVDGTAALIKQTVQQFGLLDGVFHAAGTSLTMPVRLTKQQSVDTVFGPSVYGAFGIARAAGQKNIMAERASIVLMSSIAAESGHGGMMVYGAAKSALYGLVRSAGVELAAKGVRVNAIVAGAVYTEMYSREIDKMGADWVPSVGFRHPLGFGETDDITNAVIYLMSDAGKWITGTMMTIDGGYTA